MSNKNEWNNWIEEAISISQIRYYKYKDFYNIEKIDNDNFRKLYRANWKNSEQCFALKSFNIDNTIVKKIISELELYRKINFHKNIVKFFGITDKVNPNGQSKKYLLVMEYSDDNSLQNYLKEHVKKLTWEDKYKLADQLVCAVSYLHDKGIVYCGLNSSDILVHQNNIKLANFGLSKRVKVLSDIFDIVAYIDPKWFVRVNYSNNLIQFDALNEMSDIYGIGVLLWEISSGQSPFEGESYDDSLITKILQGYRETIVPGTPRDYSNLYTDCWDTEPGNRPTMYQVIVKLKATFRTAETNLDIVLSQKFDKMNIKEIGPTNQNINETIFEEDLSIVIDELIDFYFMEVNKGKEVDVRKRFVCDYINNRKIDLQEIYNWLLNNQDDSNSIFLLGYFNYHGIGTNINKQKAFELYQKAEKLENSAAQFDLTYMHVYGKGIDKNHKKVFELSEKLASKEYSAGINLLGYCYSMGIGVGVNKQKAVELYQKSANLGNSRAQCNLALMYEVGEGVEQDNNKAFELSKKSAEGKHSCGINLLGYCYNLGIGTKVNMQKAFELYQESANLGNDVAQYNLATMYENGEGTEKNMKKAIYWYKKSAELGYNNAQVKLENFQNE